MSWAVRNDVEAAFADDEARFTLLGRFEPADSAHVATLLALSSSQRQQLFDECTHANWRHHGVHFRATIVAAGHPDVVVAATLVDDLLATPQLGDDIYERVLGIVGERPELQTAARVHVAVREARFAMPRRPRCFLEAARLLRAVSDGEAAREHLLRAIRYGVSRDDLTADERAVVADGVDGFERGPELLLLERAMSVGRTLVRDVDEVAARASCLTAVAWRAAQPGLRPLVLPAERARATAEVATVLASLAQRGLIAQLCPLERRLLEAPLTTSMTPSCVDGSWLVEAAATLAWACGLLRLLQPPRRVELGVVVELVAGWAPKELRSVSEVSQLHRRMALCRWRLLQERTAPGVAVDVAAVARRYDVDVTGLVLVDGDLQLKRGKRLSAADVEGAWSSVVLERLRATTWLLSATPFDELDLAL